MARVAFLWGVLGLAVAGASQEATLAVPSGCAVGDTADLAYQGSACLVANETDTTKETVKEGEADVKEEASSDISGWIQSITCLTLDAQEYCAYTQPSFSHGEGISLITTSARLAEIAARFDAQVPPQGSTSLSQPSSPGKPYAETALPGKGIGLLATQAIRTGQRVMGRSAAVMVDGRALSGFARDELAALLVAAVGALPESHRAQFMNLSTHDEAVDAADRVYKIYATNAYKTAVDGGEPFHSTFVELSRMNHECSPNCAYYFDPLSMTQRVYAVRDIMPGEELTVSYIDPIQPRAARQATLEKDWGFQCTCQRCTAEPHIAAESDDRVAEMGRLFAELDDYSAGSSASPGKAELLVTLFGLEGLQGRMHEAYYRAALEYSGVGDVGMAVKYARLCRDRGLLVRGPEQPFLASMTKLIQTPEEHWSWRLRIRDQTPE